MASVTSSLQENQYTSDIDIVGYFDISISGTFSATVTVQRSFNGTDWFDVDTFTSATEAVGFNPTNCRYRAGIKTGAYTSGTAVVSIFEQPETSRSIQLA